MAQSKPDPIEFERMRGLHFYERIAFRAPRAGEFFLSGAIVSAYLAYHDMTQRFAIVRPTFRARRVTRYERGESV
jgi:hypothetical protein